MKQVSAKYNLDYKLTSDFNKIVQINDKYRFKNKKAIKRRRKTKRVNK